MLRMLGTVLYAVAAVAILAFIFMNREPVSITFLPLATPITAPLYLVLSAVFILGLMIGLLYSASLALHYERKLRRQSRALEHMESELTRIPAHGPTA